MKVIYWLCMVSILICSETKAEFNPVGFQVFRLYDESRNRLVEMDVWYPTDSEEESMISEIDLWFNCPEIKDAKIKDENKRYPLIIMSHGNGGERRDRTWLVHQLVAQDYIVVSVDHFGDHWNYSYPDLFLSAWDRPLDITFSLDYLLEKSSLAQQIDPDRIGFSSYSFGGMAGLWLAGGIATDFETCLKRYQYWFQPFPDDIVQNLEYEKSLLSYFDPRIKAYLLMAPPSWAFNYDSLKAIDRPFFLLGAEGDDILPPCSHACYLADVMQDSECHILNHPANHYVFLNEPTDLAKQNIPEKFCQDDPEIKRSEVHEIVGEIALNFFKKHLK